MLSFSLTVIRLFRRSLGVALVALAVLAGGCGAADGSRPRLTGETVAEDAPTAPLSEAVEATALGSADSGAIDVAVDSGTDRGSRGLRSAPDGLAYVDAGTSELDASEVTGELELAWFVAAVEESLVGTDAEGVVLADPQSYVAAGLRQCEILTAGGSIETAVIDLIDDPAVGTDSPEVAGSVTGAAIEALCPEHAGLLG